MSVKFLRNLLLLGGASMLSLYAKAQQPTQPVLHSKDKAIDAAVIYTAERGKVAGVDCGCFWLQGGSGNVAFTFFHGLGVAAELTGESSGNIANGVSLSKVMFGVGPRYTYHLTGWKHPSHDVSLFGESLFGVMHGFNGTFSSSSGAQTSASSFGLQIGGGLNFALTPLIGIRAIEADYVRSTLPNGFNNTQNDVRLGAGISLHFRP